MPDYRKPLFSKYIIWPLLAVLLVTSMVFPVRAETSSADIPKTVRNAVEDPQTQILRVYNTAPFTNPSCNGQAYYIAVNKDRNAVALRETDDGIIQFYTGLNPKVLDFFVSDRILDHMDSGTEIADVYCLDGSAYNQGTVIWYTVSHNKAIFRFVYFYHPQIGEFLFPQSDFEAYRKAVIQDPQMRYGLYDLRPYDLSSDNFDLTTNFEEDPTPVSYFIWICVGSTLLIGTLTVILTRMYKKKARHLDDPVVPLCIVCPKPDEPLMDLGNESAIGYLP